MVIEGAPQDEVHQLADGGWSSRPRPWEAPGSPKLPAQVDYGASDAETDQGVGCGSQPGPHSLLASERFELVDAMRRRTATILDRHMQILHEEVQECGKRIVNELFDEEDTQDMLSPGCVQSRLAACQPRIKKAVTLTFSGSEKNVRREENFRRMGACLDLLDVDAEGSQAAHREPLMPQKSMTTGQVFCDPTQMKEQVRKALARPQYCVTDLYKKTGKAQCIARSQWFEALTLFAVLANSIWQAIEADLNESTVLVEAAAVFQITEHAFCVFFLGEWLVRLCAFERKQDAFKDKWFAFDTWLICLMVTDTWILAVLFAFSSPEQSITLSPSIVRLVRILRLTRMARMARLLRWMPELVILLKGLWHASKSVICTLILLLVTLYLFGLAFKQLAYGTELGNELFPTVSKSMMTLMLRAVLPDVSGVLVTVAEAHWGLAILLFIFILLAYLTVMNLLVGVLVEVVSMVSRVENEAVLVSKVRTELLALIQKLGLDLDGNGTLSKDEFEAMLITPIVAQFMQDVGVDVVGLVEYTEYIFKDRELEFHEFVELILQLRGSNLATVKDIVDMRKAVMQELETINSQIPPLAHTLDKLPGSVEKAAATAGRQQRPSFFWSPRRSVVANGFRGSQSSRQSTKEQPPLEKNRAMLDGGSDYDRAPEGVLLGQGGGFSSNGSRIGRRRSVTVVGAGGIDRCYPDVDTSPPRMPAPTVAGEQGHRRSSAIGEASGTGGNMTQGTAATGTSGAPVTDAKLPGSLAEDVTVGCQGGGAIMGAGREDVDAGSRGTSAIGNGPGSTNSACSRPGSPVVVSHSRTSPALGGRDNDISSLASLRFASRSYENLPALPGVKLPPLEQRLPRPSAVIGTAPGVMLPQPAAASPELSFFKDFVWSLPGADPLGDPLSVDNFMPSPMSPTHVVRSFTSPAAPHA